MEAERRRLLTRRRKPLADRTNTSSSAVPLRPSKSNLSSSSSCASNKLLPKRASTTDLPPNLDNNALNPSFPQTPALSTPSLKPSSHQGTVDVEAEEPIAVSYSLRDKRKDKGKEVTDEGDLLSSNCEKSDGAESKKLSKALTVSFSSCSSAPNKRLSKHASTTYIPVNLDNNALNPSSPQTPALSTPPLKPSSLHAEAPIPVYSRTRSSNKRKDKGKEVADDCWEKSDGVESQKLPKALTVPCKKIKNLIQFPNSPRTPALSTRSLKPSSLHGTVDIEAEEPITVFYSRRNKRKDKGKEVADEGDLPFSNWEKSDVVESEKLHKALTVPCIKIKRQLPVSSNKDELKDPVLQDYIEKQNAYFKMIDEFQLSEEEVESDDDKLN